MKFSEYTEYSVRRFHGLRREREQRFFAPFLVIGGALLVWAVVTYLKP